MGKDCFKHKLHVILHGNSQKTITLTEFYRFLREKLKTLLVFPALKDISKFFLLKMCLICKKKETQIYFFETFIRLKGRSF